MARKLIDLLPPDKYHGVVRGHVHMSLINGIDPSYQRQLSGDHVQRLDAAWRWELCDPILLARRDDGSLWIVKGQHRVARLKLAGESWVFATVIDSTGVRDEAEWFYVDATGMRLLNRMDKYRANTVRQDPDTVAMNATLARFGYRVDPASSGHDVVRAIGAVERVWSWGGEPLLTDVLGHISGVWGTFDGNRDGDTIAGLGLFLKAYRESTELDRTRLRQVMADNGPRAVMAQGVNNAKTYGLAVAGSNKAVLFANGMRELYNGKGRSQRLGPVTQPNGKRAPRRKVAA